MIGILLVGLLLCSPLPSFGRQATSIGKINVTAYTYYKKSKNITASGIKVREGHVALSPDIRRRFKPKFGDKILLEGLGLFEYQDHMPNQWHRKADVFIGDGCEARQFGVKKGIHAWLIRKEEVKPD